MNQGMRASTRAEEGERRISIEVRVERQYGSGRVGGWVYVREGENSRARSQMEMQSLHNVKQRGEWIALP